MTTAPKPRTGGEILVDALRGHGVDTAFCVPGESYLAELDALYGAREAIRLIVCRQESGAAFMAEAHGKLTGRPGICFVTRGPGACNASIGVHTAAQDSTPMILFVGQVDRGMLGREAFQEIDVAQMFAGDAKWAARIDDPARIPEMLSRAFHTALAGRPGPVVLGLPTDMLRETASVADTRPHTVVRPHPGAAAMADLRARLERAKRPFVLLGGGGWNAEAVADAQAFAEANRLPVGAAFRRQDLFDNDHDCWAGDVGLGINPALAARIEEADLLLAVGARLGEMTTQGYTLPAPPDPEVALIHVHPDPDELGRVYRPDLAICAGPGAFAAAARALAAIESPPWEDWRAAARADYLAWIEPPPMPGALDLARIIRTLREMTDGAAIIATDAGNFAGWGHRFYRYTRFRSQLGPTCGAMGYGVPAAIAAKAAVPDRPVIALVGDGGMMMTGQEIATALRHDIAPIVLVVNNGMFGTIRMHQERTYPDRVIATDLVNPDFVAYARAFGAHGETVAETAEFAPAFARALDAGRIAVIELRIEPEAITTQTTLSAIREAARAKAGKGR